jgi:hypothetical protein
MVAAKQQHGDEAILQNKRERDREPVMCDATV